VDQKVEEVWAVEKELLESEREKKRSIEQYAHDKDELRDRLDTAKEKT
jgi:hypothetical protein